MSKPHFIMSLTRTHWRQITAQRACTRCPTHSHTGATSGNGVLLLYDAQSTVHFEQRGAGRSPTTLTLSMLHARTRPRDWRGGTTLVHRTLANATEHRLIDRWEEQTERWL